MLLEQAFFMRPRHSKLESFITKIESQASIWYDDKQMALTDNDRLVLDYAVSNLRVELSKLKNSILVLDQSEQDLALESIFRIALFSYHVGRQSPASDSLSLRFDLKRGATARAGRTTDKREAVIAEVIERHTKGRDGAKPTNISDAVAHDLSKAGFDISSRAVRDRLIKLGLTKPRKSNRRTKKSGGKANRGIQAP